MFSYVALPEIFVATMACLVLLLDVVLQERKAFYSYVLTNVAIVGLLLLVLWQYKSYQEPVIVFHRQFIVDRLALVLKLCVGALGFFVCTYTKDYVVSHEMPACEYYALSLFSIMGVLVMISGNSLLAIYLGLEIISLPLYALVAIDRTKRASEAAFKYFIMGSLASALLLYGISLLYGFYGFAFGLDYIAGWLHSAHISNLFAHDVWMRGPIIVSVIFIVVGFAFKLGLVPFHTWVPDVYDGAPKFISLFIASIPKLAVFAVVFRLLILTLSNIYVAWHSILILLAVLSIIVGNLAALVQPNIKRLLAYSSIAQIGYLLLAVAVGSNFALSTALFYLITYVFTIAAVFALLIFVEKIRAGELINIEDLAGLNNTNPYLALLMSILVFSLIGIPPTAGFIAKFSILQALFGAGFIKLAVFMLIFAVVGAGYYLKIIKAMYFEESQEDHVLMSAGNFNSLAIISVNTLAILFLGILPGFLLDVCWWVFV